MSISRFVISALLCTSAFQVVASDTPAVVNNQVNLTVMLYDDHYLVECNPKDKDTSARNDWKAICNEMAAPQVSKLVSEGKIASVSGPVFDLANDLVPSNAGQALSKKIPLSK